MSTDVDVLPCRYCGHLRRIDTWCGTDECAERVAAGQAEMVAEMSDGHGWVAHRSGGYAAGPGGKTGVPPGRGSASSAAGVSDEQLDEWEAWSKDTDLADAFDWQYHCERVIGEVRASHAREAAARADAKEADYVCRATGDKLAAVRGQRDVLQQRIDKALETVAAWEHVYVRGNFWVRGVRAALTGTDNQSTEETP